MKKLITLLSLFIIFQHAIAQEVDFKWSTPEKISKNSSAPEVLGVVKDEALVLTSENPKDVGSYTITYHDINTLEKGTQIILENKLPKDVTENTLYNIYLIKDKLIIISVTKKDELIGSILDLKGQVIKGKISIDRADSKDKSFDGFSVGISPDESTLLGYRKTKGTDKKSTTFLFSTFNTDLKRLKTAKIKLPYAEDNIDFGKVSIDNQSNVFIVANAKIEGKKRKYDVIKSIILQLPMSEDKPEVNEIPLPLEKRLATSMSFLLFDDRLAITGMYASSSTADYLEGIFYTEISKSSLEVISTSYDKFKPGIQYRTNVADKSPGKNVGYGYVLKNIFIDEQKNKLLIFENTSIVYMADSKGNVDKYVTKMDLIVMRLNAENKIEWNTTIYKNQKLGIPYSRPLGIGIVTYHMNTYRMYKKFEMVLGYSILYENGKIYFVFNDSNKNLGKKTTDYYFNNFKKSYSALVVLDTKNGKWEKKALFKTKDTKRLITPDNSEQVSANKILVFSFEKRKANLGTLTIE